MSNETNETYEAAVNLISIFEHRFACQQGPPRAFFELPQRDGKVVRCIYVTYAVTGDTLKETVKWFIRNVTEPMLDKFERGARGYLYWRFENRIDITIDDDGRYRIHTRIVVLDDNANAVVVEEAVKPEGAPTPAAFSQESHRG